MIVEITRRTKKYIFKKKIYKGRKIPVGEIKCLVCGWKGRHGDMLHCPNNRVPGKREQRHVCPDCDNVFMIIRVSRDRKKLRLICP